MIDVQNVTKRWGSFTAVDDVNLQIKAGEFITLLGPSGCGKTTLLRMISGFEVPTAGRVMLDGRDVTSVPPYRRDVNQVFQSYALFPHLTVRDNIAFGLRMKKVARREITSRVDEVVAMVALNGMEDRRPSQLSGGQRQRVALARAIVNRPKVLLLDEPLSALDAKLRHAMQIELKRLQQRLGITFLFVTHDQEEALTMSDRIAVVNKGRIEQLGKVDDIYHRPQTAFVAHFIGQANVIDVTVRSIDNGRARIHLGGDVELLADAGNLGAGATHARVSIRPEKFHLTKHPPIGDNVFPATVVEELFRGAIDELLLRTAWGQELTAVVANEGGMTESLHAGDAVYVQLHPDDIVIVRDE
ncbi:MAG TPA: ABC transporter ATP-binding protein [Tepidisphaeraceae bacterium]|jgi:spermidine/putrescine transport system ATP-binding protein|nr:ABC transporter ATP-binding protein [Tepidisphaeraceae bacterium]